VGRSYGSSFLGELSTRLARLLKFDGSIDASFNSEALPVIVVGDATAPGYGDQSLRRFAIDTGDLGPSGGADAVVFRADADVIITSILYFGRAATAGVEALNLRVYGPSAPNPVIALAAAGVFTDRAASNFDRPPVRLATGNEAVPANGAVIGYGLNWWTAAVPAGPNTTTELCPQPFCLQNGGMLWVSNSQQQDRRVVLYGRTI
jgi:hypothetical protein